MSGELKMKAVRVTVEQTWAWEAAAKRAGLSFNAWAAQILDAAAIGVSPDAPVKPGGIPTPLAAARPSSSDKRTYAPDFKAPPPEKKRRFK